MITTVSTGHSFKYRRLLTGGENVEDVQTDKHIPYEQSAFLLSIYLFSLYLSIFFL